MFFGPFQLAKIKSMFFELFQACKKLNRSHFLCGQRNMRKDTPPRKIFQLGNVHGISLRWWVCVPGCLLRLWNEYLVYFRPMESLPNLWKNFLSKTEKSHPSPNFFFQLENVHKISLRWWFGVYQCLFLLWDNYLVYLWPWKSFQN